MPERCRACKCELIWALTPSGARAPIEADASPEGNVLLLRPSGIGGVLAVTLSKTMLSKVRARGLPLRLNHFAACPEREQFQRPRQGVTV